MKRIDIEEQLNDHVDGLLDEAQARELEAWLEQHPEGRARLEQIRGLKSAAGELERHVEPGRNMWPGIRSEIETSMRFAAPRRTAHVPWWGILAASLIVGLGGAWLALQLWQGGGGSRDRFAPRVATNTQDETAPGTTPSASGGTGAPRPATSPATGTPLTETPGVSLATRTGSGLMDGELFAAEEEFIRATEQLMSALQARREQIDPKTLQFVEGNLRIINKAIGEVRVALEAEPGNPARGYALATLYKQRMQLLWMASSLTTEL